MQQTTSRIYIKRLAFILVKGWKSKERVTLQSRMTLKRTPMWAADGTWSETVEAKRQGDKISVYRLKIKTNKNAL